MPPVDALPKRRNANPPQIPSGVHPVIGEIFRLLDQNGVTREAVADAAGISLAGITQWKRHNPSITTVDAVLGVFGLKLGIVPMDGGS